MKRSYDVVGIISLPLVVRCRPSKSAVSTVCVSLHISIYPLNERIKYVKLLTTMDVVCVVLHRIGSIKTTSLKSP